MQGDEHAIRLAAFRFLEEQSAIHGDILPRPVLERGFNFRDHRIPLVGPPGIFKPAALADVPLSITTAPPVEGRPRPYEDEFTEEGFLLYRYRGTDPNHRNNVGLRTAMQAQTPLIYFHGIVPGQYIGSWPVFIVGDQPEKLTFTVAVDEKHVLDTPPQEHAEETYRRAYATRIARQRLHQADFRARVIRAYRETCAVCRLRHRELLDAAHILPDIDPRGKPAVTNGLALCKLHHAAFDQNFIGIRPDLTIEVHRRVLDEADGPMLIHGLQGFHGSTLIVPHNPQQHPDLDHLAERYDLFIKAG